MKHAVITAILAVFCLGLANARGTEPLTADRQIRLIALASPWTKEHWMLTKERGVLKDYTAQDVLEMIEELKPNCLERFITGCPEPDGLVPVREGCPPMTVSEFLNAAILAGGEGCHIVPKLNLQWLRTESQTEYFWRSAQALYDLPLANPIRNINLDVWDYYCNEIHPDPAQRDAMFQRLRDIGYEQIGVNMTGLYRMNHPQIDYADFNINKETWEVNVKAIETLKAFPNIGRLYMYIDYPGPMNAFRENTPDRQADIYTDIIYPAQVEMGFTFVYAILQDSWDARSVATSPDGRHEGKTIYEIIKELLNR